MLPSDPDVTELLTRGRIEVEGRLVDASNATLFCEISGGDAVAHCVYKPVSGERALWDFPDGTLAGREVSTYLLDQALGWDLVPPTLLRDGPFGPGMCQLWVHVDETVDLAALARSDHPDLRRMAVFDAVVNNADRKGGHLLPREDGRVQGVDHGICFSAEDKLRTLLWQWRGERLTDEAVEVLSSLRAQLEGPLGEALSQLLTVTELRASAARSTVSSTCTHSWHMPGPNGPSRMTVGGTTSQPVAWLTRYAPTSRPASVPSGKSHSGRSPATGL